MQRILICLLCLVVTPAWAANWQQQWIQRAGRSSVIVETTSGKKVFEHRPSVAMVPASTIKVATSLCALNTLGPDYRFPTEFYTVGPDLYMKGYGDPSLVSEELALIAQALRQQGLRSVRNIYLDSSYFAKDLPIDGRSRSNNPYDGHNAAVLVNFNTINVAVRGGRVSSAEAQTPMTPLTTELAKGLRNGTHRINLAKHPKKALRYAGELLGEFLKQQGVKVHGSARIGTVPQGTAVWHRYRSSKTVTDNVRSLLEFSNNIVTNQLFLTLGAAVLEAPATVPKAQAVLRSCAKRDIGWKNVTLMEGSGLSRKNKVTASQMLQLLKRFEPHADLLPLKKKLFRAKTGTLSGVSSLVGYFTKHGQQYRFVIMQNDPKATYNSKFTLAKMIYDNV